MDKALWCIDREMGEGEDDEAKEIGRRRRIKDGDGWIIDCCRVALCVIQIKSGGNSASCLCFACIAALLTLLDFEISTATTNNRRNSSETAKQHQKHPKNKSKL